jgi:hypothetical protein
VAARELALEGEREPEAGDGVDDLEGIHAADPDWLRGDIADEDLLRNPGNAVEKVGGDAADDQLGEDLAAEDVERAPGFFRQDEVTSV